MVICINCNKEFTPKNKNNKLYCSKNCRNKYYNKKRLPTDLRNNICPICKIEFKAVGQKVYCSNKCKRKSYKNKTGIEKYKEMDRLRGNRKISRDRQKCLDLIGNKCLVCDSSNNIMFHEKYGTPHLENTHPSYYLKNSDRFIPLCFEHHRLVHGLSFINNNIEQLNKAIELSKMIKND